MELDYLTQARLNNLAINSEHYSVAGILTLHDFTINDWKVILS